MMILVEQLRDVNFFIFLDRARNPSSGISVSRLERWNDLMSHKLGKVEISARSAKRSNLLEERKIDVERSEVRKPLEDAMKER
jgi:hypothetical protein